METTETKYWHCDFNRLELRISGDVDEIDVWCMLFDVDGKGRDINEWDFLSEGEMVEFFAGLELDEYLVEGDVNVIPYEFRYGDGQGYTLTRDVDVRIHNWWIE